MPASEARPMDGPLCCPTRTMGQQCDSCGAEALGRGTTTRNCSSVEKARLCTGLSLLRKD